MQIFLPYSEPIRVAKVLDPRRLNKQILECSWILDAIPKNTRARFHPITKMYANDLPFVSHYQNCLRSFKEGDVMQASFYSEMALCVFPNFLKNVDWYFDNFKKRLYTKDPNFYSCFKEFGESFENYYYVGGTWIKYEI